MSENGTTSNGKQSCENERLYHERQVRAMCALHALNNLFQREHTFTKKDLDSVCERLSPDTFINPHRSMLGLGNYDVNVLMAALQEKGYETVWFDKRKSVNTLVPDNIMGFILNTPSDYKVGPLHLPLNGKHWIALRKLHGVYMNLDSKLAKPETIGDQDKLKAFLGAELEGGKKELLLVVKKDVYSSDGWTTAADSVHKDGAENRLEFDKQTNGACLESDSKDNAKPNEDSALSRLACETGGEGVGNACVPSSKCAEVATNGQNARGVIEKKTET